VHTPSKQTLTTSNGSTPDSQVFSQTGDYVSLEVDYKISGPVTRRAAEELRDMGKFDELADLLQNVSDGNVE
jgi:hypothetical protein